MDTALRGVPVWERINLRILTFVAVVAAIILVLFWGVIEQAVTGGIVNRGDYLQVDLYTISNFEMDQFNATDESIPARFRSLDGKRVSLTGEMYQPYAVGGEIAEFDLVYSISKCCVGPAPKIQHFVKSKVVPGSQVNYYPGLVDVVGTLHVGIEKADGRVTSVYRFEVESVRRSS